MHVFAEIMHMFAEIMHIYVEIMRIIADFYIFNKTLENLLNFGE